MQKAKVVCWQLVDFGFERRMLSRKPTVKNRTKEYMHKFTATSSNGPDIILFHWGHDRYLSVARLPILIPIKANHHLNE